MELYEDERESMLSDRILIEFMIQCRQWVKQEMWKIKCCREREI